MPGDPKLQAALSLPSKINQKNNRQIREGGKTPIESEDNVIRIIQYLDGRKHIRYPVGFIVKIFLSSNVKSVFTE